MSWLHADGMLRALGSTSIQVAVGILLLVLIERLWGQRLSPRWRYGLWLLVLARLALPVVPQVTGGVPNPTDWVAELARPDAAKSGPRVGRTGDPGPLGASSSAPFRATRSPGVDALEAEGSGVESKGPGLPARPSSERQSPDRIAPPAQVRLHPGSASETTSAGTRRPSGSATDSSPGPFTSTPPEDGPSPWSRIALALWLGVATLLAVVTLRREQRFARSVRAEPSLDDPRLNALLDECVETSGLERRPALVASDLVRTPALFGGRSPRILIPGKLVHGLDDGELRHIFLHELAHQRHRDVLLNGLFQLLRCAYWFHPLIPLALRRTRAAQEIVRDFEAIESAREHAPLGYARTLIKLLESCPSTQPANRAVCMVQHGPTTRRRILMIADFAQRPRRTAAVGLAIAGALTWVTFTSAAPRPTPDATNASTNSASPASENPERSGDGIRVIHHREPAAWALALEEKLDQRVSVNFEDTDIFEALRYLSVTTGTNIVGSPDLWDYGLDSVTLRIEETSLRQVLWAMGSVLDGMAWTLHDGVIFVGIQGEIPMEFELRIYDIDPLLAPPEVEDSAEWHSTLEEMIRDFGCNPDIWDEYPEASLMLVDRTLMVRQTPEQHRRIEGFLNRLLAEGSDDESHVPAWREELRERLASMRIDLHTGDESLGEIAERLSALLGITILVYEDYQEETPQLQLDDIPADRALRWLARPHGLEVNLKEGVVVLEEGFELETHIYDVSDLVAPTEDESTEDKLDLLMVLIQENAGVTTWDEDGVVLTNFRHLLVTHNRPEVHGEVKSLLSALRRFQGR